MYIVIEVHFGHVLQFAPYFHLTGKLITDTKIYSMRFQSSTFCMAPGARLNNHQIGSMIGDTPRQCLRQCLINTGCRSFNFNSTSNACELNNASSLGWLTGEFIFSDFEYNLHMEVTHYDTQSSCN